MTTPTIIKPADLPAPTTLIDAGDGSLSALMFWFLPEDTVFDLGDIARGQGFDQYSIKRLEDDDEQSDLYEAYTRDASPKDVLPIWNPRPPKDDGKGEWIMVMRTDSEDGPWAMFVRKTDAALQGRTSDDEFADDVEKVLDAALANDKVA